MMATAMEVLEKALIEYGNGRAAEAYQRGVERGRFDRGMEMRKEFEAVIKQRDRAYAILRAGKADNWAVRSGSDERGFRETEWVRMAEDALRGGE